MLSNDPILRPYRHSRTSDLTAQQLADAIVGDSGIYKVLEPRWEAYKAHQAWHALTFQGGSRGAEPSFNDENGEPRTGHLALSPCDTINHQLNALVELCISRYGDDVVSDFFEIVRSNPEYMKRLSELPALTGAAEAEMEKHYAKHALEKFELPEPGNGHININEDAIHAIKGRAEERLGHYLSKHHIAFHKTQVDGLELLVADHPEDKREVARVRRILRLEETLQPFPYTHNYEHIAYGEKHLLQAVKHHGNTTDSIIENHQDTLLRNAHDADKQRIIDQNPDSFGYPDLENKYMTFVGSGSLPLTGIMNNIITGCQVNLIDSDPEAVEISRKLTTYLELLGVVEKDSIRIYSGDAKNVYYGGPRSDDVERDDFAGELKCNTPHVTVNTSGDRIDSSKDMLYVPTDILYIAGLIPNDVKHSILLNLEHNQADPVKTIMVRSARGLSAMLYEPIQESVFQHNSYYHPHATIVPERHVAKDMDTIRANTEETLSHASVSAILSDDNVNTAELLFRSPLPMENPSIPFERGSKIAKLLQEELGREPDFSHVARIEARTSRDPDPTRKP